MTVRMATCAELSDNVKEIERIQGLYWTLEKSATPTALLLPWFPGRAKKAKEVATRELFLKLKYYVDLRREAKVPTTDAIDILIGQGQSTPDIIQVCNSVFQCGPYVFNTVSDVWITSLFSA